MEKKEPGRRSRRTGRRGLIQIRPEVGAAVRVRRGGAGGGTGRARGGQEDMQRPRGRSSNTFRGEQGAREAAKAGSDQNRVVDGQAGVCRSYRRAFGWK